MVCHVVVVWARPLTPSPADMALLDDAETGRFHGYRREADRRRFLTGRVLAKTEIARRLNAVAAHIAFDATCPDCGKPHGKPHVRGAEHRVALSISHSADRVVVALTDGAPVGVDVEQATRERTADLQKYALANTEQQAVQRLPEDVRDAAFHTYWARKEAVAKATGRGLRLPLTSIVVSPPNEKPRLLHSPLEDAVALSDVDPGEGYRAAVAVMTDDQLSVTERWSPRPSPEAGS